MKALLLKEWYSFSRNYAVFYFAFAVIRIILLGYNFFGFSGFTAMANNSLYGNLLYIIIIPFMCVRNLDLDEREKWDIYRSALPFSKKEIVYSKYIFSTVITIFFVLISAISMLPNLFEGYITVNDFTSMLTWIITILISLLSIMFVGAFALKNKARIIYIISILLCSIVVFFVAVGYNETSRQKYVKMQIASDWMLEEKFESILLLTPTQQLFLLGISIVIFLVSIILSINFYENSKA